ncbi:MAG: GntR family transcriptional regulator, partial [Sphaerochaetaceae bacterium]|nr:GntR family transcriptional regulator [Sphaerochaetaceae bacterium]
MNAEALSVFFTNSQGNSLKRESVPSSIANMIIDYITAKKLKPGDQLPTEQEFMTYLGVGRNSVREAIKMLSFLGVVEIRKGIGSYISDSISSSALNPLVLSLAFEQ